MGRKKHRRVGDLTDGDCLRLASLRICDECSGRGDVRLMLDRVTRIEVRGDHHHQARLQYPTEVWVYVECDVCEGTGSVEA